MNHEFAFKPGEIHETWDDHSGVRASNVRHYCLLTEGPVVDKLQASDVSLLKLSIAEILNLLIIVASHLDDAARILREEWKLFTCCDVVAGDQDVHALDEVRKLTALHCSPYPLATT